jgi:hypothetical protein
VALNTITLTLDFYGIILPNCLINHQSFLTISKDVSTHSNLSSISKDVLTHSNPLDVSNLTCAPEYERLFVMMIDDF